MFEVLTWAVTATFATVVVIAFTVLCIFLIVYITDNWDLFADWFKLVGGILMIFVFWLVVFGVGKLSMDAQPVKAEVENVSS